MSLGQGLGTGPLTGIRMIDRQTGRGADGQGGFAGSLYGYRNTIDAGGHRTEAVKHYEEAASLAEQRPLPYIAVGSIYLQMEQPREAVRAFDLALKWFISGLPMSMILGVLASLVYRRE